MKFSAVWKAAGRVLNGSPILSQGTMGEMEHYYRRRRQWAGDRGRSMKGHPWNQMPRSMFPEMTVHERNPTMDFATEFQDLHGLHLGDNSPLPVNIRKELTPEWENMAWQPEAYEILGVTTSSENARQGGKETMMLLEPIICGEAAGRDGVPGEGDILIAVQVPIDGLDVDDLGKDDPDVAALSERVTLELKSETTKDCLEISLQVLMGYKGAIRGITFVDIAINTITTDKDVDYAKVTARPNRMRDLFMPILGQLEYASRIIHHGVCADVDRTSAMAMNQATRILEPDFYAPWQNSDRKLLHATMDMLQEGGPQFFNGVFANLNRMYPDPHDQESPRKRKRAASEQDGTAGDAARGAVPHADV